MKKEASRGFKIVGEACAPTIMNHNYGLSNKPFCSPVCKT